MMPDRRGFSLRCAAEHVELVGLVCGRFDGVSIGEHDGEKLRVEVDCWQVPEDERDAYVEHVRRTLETAISLHRVSER